MRTWERWVIRVVVAVIVLSALVFLLALLTGHAEGGPPVR